MTNRILARIALVAPLAALPALIPLAGCRSDDPGHSKTTTKETVKTPSGQTTITETHETDTKVHPK